MQREYTRGGAVVDALFNHYMSHPDQMPGRHSRGRERGGGARARRVADYIAGMTDRYADRRYRAVQS